MTNILHSAAPTCVGTQLLVDRYRCGEDSANFMFSGQVRPAQGFFRFGNSAICYGQCSSGKTHASAKDPLYDALDQVVIDDLCIYLPFDPAQVIDNLRAERYWGNAGGLKTLPGSQLFRSCYYTFRPLMPVSVRKHLQRFYFRGWQQIPFPEWPVDVTVENIHERLMLLALKARGGKPIPFVWFWPKGAPSCTIVTHDVEMQSGIDLSHELMDLNDSFGVKTSFQVVPEERYTVPDSFLNQIQSRGFEVNVHDLNHDGHLFRDKAEFLRRAELINRYVRSFGALGFRSAVMYRNIDWYHALDVMYDMSVPNVSHLDPQQGGCCTVLPFFVGNIIELPVTMTQDYSLFHILRQYSTDLWIEQSKRIRQKNGLISVIVHPDYVSSKKARQVYKDLLVHLTELRSAGQTWIALPREVAHWWRQRSKLTLVPCGDSWRIEGEGNEQATLAYAVLDGDSLRYEFAPRA
jgi:hypothetical protein